MSVIRILNDPTHQCNLPGPSDYPAGTHVRCEDVILGGRFEGGKCGRQYTRITRFWRPKWANYDYGW